MWFESWKQKRKNKKIPINSLCIGISILLTCSLNTHSKYLNFRGETIWNRQQQHHNVWISLLKTRRLLIFISSHLSYPKLMLLIWYSFLYIFLLILKRKGKLEFVPKMCKHYVKLTQWCSLHTKGYHILFLFNVYTLHIISSFSFLIFPTLTIDHSIGKIKSL